MPDERPTLTPDDVQTIENVLGDTTAAPQTRRWLLKNAAIGIAAAGLLGPAGSALAKGTRRTAATDDDVNSVVTTAVTAEALAVTYLTGVIGAAKGTKVAKFLPVLKAANAAEYDHYKVLGSLGAKPLTTRFWAPDALFGKKLENVFPTIEFAETVFVNAYLVGITVFANAGKPDLARYAGEILGVEAEHRALARFAQGKLPNNKAFESYALKTTAEHVMKLESAGIGFGKEGKKPGKFYEFHAPPKSALVHLESTKPS